MPPRIARAIKRLVDVLVSAMGLAGLSPLLVVLGAISWWYQGWPVVFTQDRPGRHGRVFRLYKFRTMTNATDASGQLLPDEARLTPIGRFLRKTSLDEVPQLFNVLRGEMSLIGPRPLLVRYLDRYTPEHHRRHDVRPGITGWAQVNGRNAVAWHDRFDLDVWYVDNWSLALDARVLWQTVRTVFRREGISGSGSETMTEYMGPTVVEAS